MAKPKSSVMDKVDFDLYLNVEDYNNNNNGTTIVTSTAMNPRIRKYDDYTTEDPQNPEIPSKKPKTSTATATTTTTMGPPSHPLEHASTNDPSTFHHTVRARLAAQNSIPRVHSNMNGNDNGNSNTSSRTNSSTTIAPDEHDPPPSPSSNTTSSSSSQITDGRILNIPVNLEGLPSATSSAAGSFTLPRSAVFTIYEDPDETDLMDIDPFCPNWMYPEDDKENEDRLSYVNHRVEGGNSNGNGNENENDDGDADNDDTIEDELVRPMGVEAYSQQQNVLALFSGGTDTFADARGNYYLSEDQDASVDDVGFHETVLLPWGSEYGSGGGGQRLHRRHSRRGLRWDEGS